MFYETTALDAESSVETSTEHWSIVSDLQNFKIANPTSKFELIALMDYDEDLIFTMDFVLEPGTYDPALEP